MRVVSWSGVLAGVLMPLLAEIPLLLLRLVVVVMLRLHLLAVVLLAVVLRLHLLAVVLLLLVAVVLLQVLAGQSRVVEPAPA